MSIIAQIPVAHDSMGDNMDVYKENVICKACNKGHAIVGDCATKCSNCGASIDPDTGEPFTSNGGVVYCGQFGGCHVS